MTKAAEIVPVSDYAMVKMGPEKLTAIMKQNMGPSGVSDRDLDSITMPSGGGTHWSVPGLEGDEPAKEIVGVVVAFRDGRVYWKEALDVAGALPPDCSSEDGIKGIGSPGGECESCPMAQFGSAIKGKGQACNSKRKLFVVRPNTFVPIIVSLPPTSLAPARKFFLRLASEGLAFYSVVVRIGLEEDKNADGIKYSKATFTVAAKLSEEEQTVFKEMGIAIGMN